MDIFIFSNGSLVDGSAGAGFVTYRGLTQEVGREVVPLDASPEMYDAEVIAAVRGLSAALDNPMAQYATSVLVCLNNHEAALRLLAGTPTATSATQIQQFRQLARVWPERGLSPGSQLGSVNVCWCPGHAGILGNEAADSLAKQTP